MRRKLYKQLIETNKILLNLDLLNNQVNIEIDKVNLQNNISNISNFSANKAFISFKISNLVKNNLKAEKIILVQGGGDVHNSNEFFNTSILL